MSIYDEQHEVSPYFIKRYEEKTKDKVMRVESNNLRVIKKFIYPHKIRWADGEPKRYRIGEFDNDTCVSGKTGFRLGDYIVKHCCGVIRVYNAEEMECRCIELAGCRY